MAVETIDPSGIDSSNVLGSAVQRREDPELLTGDAEYTDDIQRAGMVHLGIVRSQYAHAVVESIDPSAATAMDGVLAVYTQEDVAASDAPGVVPVRATPSATEPVDRPMLADGTVRYQGQPVAAVVAEDRYTATEAADAVEVAYDRLDAVADPLEAVEEGAPQLHEAAEHNVAMDTVVGDETAVEAAFETADRTASVDLVNQRLIPNAMEPRASIADYTPSSGALTVEVTTQNPHLHRGWYAAMLGIPQGKIRVRAPRVGGGFGQKIHAYPADGITAWASMQLGRPVKWTASRSEDYLAGTHGRDHRTTIELALTEDGSIEAVRAEAFVNFGGYLSNVGAGLPFNFAKLVSGQYEIPAISTRLIGVYTNTTPTDAYRGAGRPEACYAIERAVDAAAGELDMDPAELRRRNFIPPGAFPYQSPTGHEYDSGEYERALETALDLVDYDDWRERQREARTNGRYLGIGLSSYVEACGAGPGLWERGAVEFDRSGGVTVKVGTFDHGQGHHTSYAQIVSDRLGVPYEDVEVVDGDTAEVPEGNGTYGSRTAAVGGSAVVESTEKIVEKARAIAAHTLEADEADIEFHEGEFQVAGAPDRAIGMQAVAQKAFQGAVPEGMEPGLEASSFYDPPNHTFPFGTHVAVVEVDRDTGEVAFERYCAVDDAGEQINPKLVEGQIQGGIAQGVGQALYEGAVYDDNATMVTGSMQDYTVPKAEHVPAVELEETVTPCPHNPLGVKGVGEAGTIAAPPAVVNAVVDALEPFGVDPSDLDMPLSSETVWQAIEDAT